MKSHAQNNIQAVPGKGLSLGLGLEKGGSRMQGDELVAECLVGFGQEDFAQGADQVRGLFRFEQA